MADPKILVDAALAAWEDDILRAKLAVTQAVLESNWIRNPSLLAIKYNNLFGIKGSGTAGSVDLMTYEYEDGEWKREPHPFAVNKSLEESFNQHKRLMYRPRYVSVRGAKTLEDVFNAVWKSGYATDPKYPQKLMNIYKQHLVDLFDE